MSIRKYEFTGETKEFNGIFLRKIKRIRDGIIGGWIEKESNLSHFGNAWVHGDAWVFGNAQVYGDALICGNARVFGDAQVSKRKKSFEYEDIIL